MQKRGATRRKTEQEKIESREVALVLILLILIPIFCNPVAELILSFWE